MKRWISAGLFVFFGLCACSQSGTDVPQDHSFQWQTLDGKRPLIIAHRGASGYRPEHTLEAYRLAIEMSADVVEPDLVITKDGVLVARHDRYLSTTTNVADKPEFANRKRSNPDPNGAPREDWWVEDFTLAELKTLRARQPFEGRSKQFDDQFEIPTFKEMLALVSKEATKAGRPVGVYPETKHPGYFASIGLDFEAPLLAALKDFDAGPVFIQSFEPEILKRLNGKTDAKLVQLVYEETPGAGSNISLQEIATYADGVGPAKALIIAFAVGRKQEDDFSLGEAHNLGLLVHPWTFRDDQTNDDIERMAAIGNIAYFQREYGKLLSTSPKASETEIEIFIELGVDGIFTDFPDTVSQQRTKIVEKPRFKFIHLDD